MRNLLLLFINILVFSSISFSQITSSPANQVCQGSSMTFTYTGSVPNNATYSWSFTGGQPNITTSSAVSPSVQFNLAGICLVQLTINQGLNSQNIIPPISVQILGSQPSISVNNTNSNFCVGSAITPITYTISGGASPTLSSGSLNGLTSTSTQNTSLGFISGYTLTISGTPTSSGCLTAIYSSSALGSCSGSSPASFNLSSICVNSLPTASISYADSPFCKTLTTGQSVTLTGTNGTGAYTGGVYSASPIGLSIDASTGAIIPSTSTAGTYTVTYTIAAANGCAPVLATTTVTITTLPTASISYAGSPFCKTLTAGQAVTQTGTSGGTYTANPTGLSINTSTGAIIPSTSTAGTYTVTYSIAASGGCVAVTTTTSVTITAAPTATIVYAGPFCQTLTTAQSVTLNGTGAYTGGAYSASPIGLSIDASSGAIIPSTSTAGTYTVTYTIAASGGCAAVSTTASLTITALPTAAISYAGSPFCKTLTAGQAVTQTGTSGGTYTANPTGLSINTSTGAIIPSTSTAGTYTVTYTIAASGGCVAVTTTTSVTITAAPTATIVYAGPFCQTLTTAQSVTLNGTGAYTGGAYSASPIGLSIDASSGAIIPSISSAGTYIVTYTIAASGGCAAVSTTASVTITTLPSPNISYAGSPFCSSLTSGVVLLGGTGIITGGTYSSSPGGLALNTISGGINPSTSTAGTYTVTYTIAATGGCSAVSTTATVTITTLPSATLSYTSTSFCQTLASPQIPNQTGATNGLYTASALVLSIDNTNGAILPSASSAGTYTVTYTIPALNGCAAVLVPTTVTITALPTASLIYAGSPFCRSLTSGAVTLTGTGNFTGGSYSSTSGLTINGSTGLINPSTSIPGTYTITYNTPASGGCLAVSTTTSVTITALPTAIISYNSPLCNSLTSGAVTLTGTGIFAGGNYSSTTGLTINGTTGEITPSSSIPGTYTVTYNTPASGGCAALSITATVTITALPTAAISYAGSPFCKTLTAGQAVTQIGTSGGTYTANPTGLSINASTGAIIPSTSIAGTYTVTYTIAASGGCVAVTTTTNVTITAAPTATIVYAGPFCQTLTTAQSVTLNGTGAYTGGAINASPIGLSIDGITGAITPSTSTAGTYTVTYTIAAANGCAPVLATTTVTITALPTAAISYAGSPLCKTLTAGQAVTQTGTSGGTYTANPTGLSINTSTGAIIPSTSTAGTYTVTYSIAASGGCVAVTTTTSVTITAAPTATIVYAGPFCQTLTTAQSVTLNGTGAYTGGAYSASPIGLSIDASTGAIIPSTSSAGTYIVTYTIAASGGCSAVSTTASVTITALPTASIIYAGSPFCSSLTSGVVTLTGTGIFTGGSYSSTSGLTINGSTGLINPSLSIPNTYNVTYTTLASGGCLAVSTTANVTITALPSATINYTGSPFCNTLSITQSVSQTGTTGGTYSSTAGLTINASTGAITPSTSTAGTYTVTYTIAASGGCSAVSTTASVTITTLPSASINYAGSPFCNSLTSGVVTLIGTGGSYSSTSGLIINGSTGLINPSLSIPGSYTVTYTISALGGCAAVIATNSVTITAAPTATIIYTSSPFCNSLLSTQSVTLSGTTGGTFSSTTGLSINVSTGAITPNTSTAGTYTVTYTIPALNGCAALITTSSVTITTLPSATISYAGSPFCKTLSSAQPVSQTGTTGGTYSSTTGLTINASTGAITPSTSTAGTYTVTYTIVASGGCSAVSTTASVTITALPTATISYSSPLCNSLNSGAVNLTGTGIFTGGSYSSTSGLAINGTTGEINPNLSIPGTYTVTYNTPTSGGCPAVSTTASVTITALPSATISYVGSPFCSSLTSGAVNLTGTGIFTSGNYSSTSGLTINGNTGLINPSLSIPGSYTVTYTTPASGGCAAVTTTTSVIITALPTATISYSSPFCSTSSTLQNVNFIGTTGGIYSSSPLNLSLNTSNGAITPSLSTAGIYTVTYTIAASGGCSAVSTTTNVTITVAPSATINYLGSPFCKTLSSAQSVAQTGTSGGSYSSNPASGLSFNSSTGAITPNTSTAGIYTVSYTISASGGCPQFQTQTNVTITAAPTATISYANTPFCSTIIAAQSVQLIGTTGGAYASTSGLIINPITGEINPSTSTIGTYTVTYTIAAAGGCAAFSTNTTVTIASPTIPTFAQFGPFCQNFVNPGILPTSSTNSTPILGSWNPTTINTSLVGITNYTFTPTASVFPTCATSIQISITINSPTIPTFSQLGQYCQNQVPGTLQSTSSNNISGTWIPATISTALPGTSTYTFNPTSTAAPTCAVSTPMNITTNPPTIPSFSPLTYCQNNIPGILQPVSLNGISGTWSPATISTAIIGNTNYTFNPTTTAAPTCAVTTQLSVSTNPNPSPTIVSSSPNNSACFGGIVTLTVGNITPLNSCTYEWFRNSVSVGTGNSYAAGISGSYEVKALNIATGCFSNSAQVVVTIHPNIPVSIIIPPNSSTSFCEGTSSITLTADPLIGYTYVWSNGQTSSTINLSLASQSNPYTVTVTNTVTNCSATSAPMPITIYPNPSAPSISPIGPLNSCAGNPLLTLTATPSTFPTYQWKNGNVNVGSNSPSHNPASTGTYSVIATNSNGCSSLPSNSTSITIDPIPATPAIIPQTGSPLQFCQGLSINLSATINSGSTYQWFRNGIPYISGNPVNITLSGTYTLIETNSLGCSSQTSSPIPIIVYPNPTPVITALSTTVFCADPGASVTLQATPGFNSYQWTCVSPTLPTQAASSSPNFIATQSGTYTVTTTTSNNCISAVSNSIPVVVNPLPIATITNGSATSFCADPGAFVTLTAGPSGNNYQWSTSGPALANPFLASQNITQTGMYSVLVTNLVTNCTNTASLPVTVHPLPTPSIAASGPLTFCDGNSVTLTAQPSGNGYVYNWNSGGNALAYTFSTSGTHFFTVTDNNGCSATSTSATVVVNPNPIAFITPSSSPTFCQGETITLQSNPMSDNYVWSQQLSPGIFTIIASGIPSIPVSQSGIYTVTNYNPSECFTTSNPIIVTVNPLPTPLITAIGAGIPGNTEVCQGNSVFLSVSGIGITSYQWRVNGVDILGANSISYSATSSGFYSVKVWNNNNCFKISSEVEVTINPNPTAEINYLNSPDPILLCPGETIGLTAAPSSMYYSWNSPIGFEMNQFVLATTSGTYEVIVTDPATGCFDTSDPVNVTIQTLGTTSAAVIGMPSTLTLCPGSLFTLSGITSNATSFNWTLISAPAGCNLIGANTLNPTFTSGSVSGTAILRLNTSLNYACNTDSSYQDITINISPSIPTLSNNINSGLVDQVLCSNIPIDPIIFNVLDILGSGTTIPSVTIDGTTVLASTPYNGISWNFIGGQVVISGTPNFGTYTYTVNGIPTGSPSCLLTSLSGTITSQAPSLSIFSGQFTNNQIICIGTSIAPIIYDYTGIISSIDLPDGVIAQSNTSGNQYTISGTPLAVGYYNYVITTETVCGFETLLGEITVIPPITGNTSGTATTTNCDGSEFTLIGGILNSSANTNYTYLWVYSTSITGPYDPAPGINTNANYEGTIYLANDTLYFRRFVYAGDCYDYAAPVMVHVIPLGTNPNMIAFAGADQTISLGQSVELVTTGVNISEYNWSPTIGLSSATISNPFASPVSTTIYTLTVQDIYGCSYSDDITVTVLNDYSLTIPSLITPNDDGSNDFWEIPESLFYTGTTVKIINREGQEVYSSSNYDNTWDGTFNGKLLPEATYYYFIQFPNSEITHKGPVTILRNIK